MNVPSDPRSDLFSDWLEARVAGKSTPDHQLAADPDLRSMCAAAGQFHGLSEQWAQDEQVQQTVGLSTTWEDIMASNPVAFPRSSVTATHRRQPARGWGETWNRFVSAALVVALVVAVGAGAWRLAADRNGGGPETPGTNVAGLGPGTIQGSTPDQAPIASPSPAQMTPIEELPGIVDAVWRDYGNTDGPADVQDLFAVTIVVYEFDTSINAAASYDLLVANTTGEFQTQAELNPSQSLATNTVDGVGERANMVRLDDIYAGGYQLQELLFTLDGSYVFSVMGVTGGPITSDATPTISSTASPFLAELATSMVEHGQPSADDVRFYQDGTSTGGNWGFMPVAGDPLVAGMTPWQDLQVFPVDANTADPPANYPPNAEELTGIVGTVLREYAPPDVFIGSQEVSMDAATPMTAADLATTRYSAISVFVYQLETPKDAEFAFDRLTQGFLASLTDSIQGDGQLRLIGEDLSGIGDQANRAATTMTSTYGNDIRQMTFQYVTVQQGEFVFVVFSQSSLGPVEVLPDTADAPDPMLDLATHIATEGQFAADEPVFDQQGASEGGLWGFMPANDDPLLMGLLPWMDTVFYPVPEM